ncbi:MAG: hypothetical protein A2552_05555 [Sulfuricurvum sp. RIFOXYD2_FULL_44_160]|uniref:Type I restriction modification DNA specificity domain-containing protein n=1 Tax=Sulfuricurvum kujiense TaxID=148813 RepID=A0A2D3WAP7_9BACT|nr:MULTISPECIES: restriction endonuclease subunit S [Sulfuricurvum]OGV54011.1 MAG: hypothetical protein A2017_10645 [Lentisphaerae bacterium GWF2_44_16]OHD91259.1 MAG: hypothetical protein A2517_01970 [Sulfuricurvum sp. RIFOXYD12_FULL_44_77]OHD92864.1 MAG: hypothetical protein A2552_05555 [Sulfuricurvum sp. RIFOXYD2_FULL_44_160]DAB38402.1 MAG TPA: hypothetical protein CFH83_06170 [Sulfuricurvum kujiense]
MISNLPTLPDGWEWKKLGDVVTEISSKLQASQCQDLPYLSLENIESQTGKLLNVSSAKESNVIGTCSKFTKDTVIYSKLRPYLNKVAIPDFDGVGTTELIVFQPKNNLDKFFLANFLRSESVVNKINASSYGAKMPRTSSKFLKELEIPLPSLNEQKRLVALLDTLFAKIDRSLELLSENITAADLLLPSALNTVFGELGEQWETKTINEIAFVKGGKRLAKGDQLLDTETPYPYLRVTDFTNDGTISTKKMLYLSPDVHEKIKRYTISHEDLYITNVGNTIGKSGIIPKELEGANLTENAVKLVYKNKKNISNKFVYYFTKSATFIFQLESATKQMAIPKLAIMRLSEIQIPLPPLDIQTQSVAYLDSIREKVEILKHVQNDKIKNLKALKASLLDRAFKGEL